MKRIQRLRRDYAAERIWFVDDIFGLEPVWLERWAAAVESRGPRLPYKCLQRADLPIGLNVFRALARSGCQTLWMGVKSGSERVLQAMRTSIRVEEVRIAALLLRRQGMVTVAYPIKGTASGDRSP